MKAPWHILGAGAVGCLFASALHRSGAATTLLVRRLPASELERQTALLVVDSDTGQRTLTLPLSANNSAQYISHLLVTTKAYDVRKAVAEVAHRLGPASHILLMVNGMGILEELQAAYPHLQFYCGTTTEGAYSIARFRICHAGRGQTRLGQPGMQQPPDWFEQWAAIDLTTTWEPDIEAALWQKMAINCAINPLTALHQCTNGELANQSRLAATVSQLCAEIAQISAARGYPAISASLPARVAEVIAATANNRSSMLQDILNGRRTEIEYLSGYLLAVAEQLTITAPHNALMLRRIREIDGRGASE